MENSSSNGFHILLDFFGCDRSQTDSMNFWQNILAESVSGTSIAVLNNSFYQFQPQGVTSFLLLSASHLSVHTWPENGYVACDVFSCSGRAETEKVADFLIKRIIHTKVRIKRVKRGF